nr:uncharacterized protein LOC128701409 [Cherax quadricarinatus]
MKVSSSQCAMMVAAVVTSVFIFFSYGYSRGWLMQRCSSNGDHFSDPHPADAHNPPGAPNLPGAERHGAFYNNSEIATDEEDWSTKRCPLKPLKNVDELFKYITSCTLACQKPVS